MNFYRKKPHSFLKSVHLYANLKRQKHGYVGAGHVYSL